MRTNILGYSTAGLPIFTHSFGESSFHVLIIGGVHGDETEGIWLSRTLLGEFSKRYPYSFQLTLIPVFNPDGAWQRRRTNENLVDLNRNLPTKDWSAKIAKEKYHPGKSPNSEPENKALIKWLESRSVKFIISCHSWKPLINVNGNCSPIAEVLSQETGYKIEKDIGYPTPGSLGTYCGKERNIPTITYEIERGSSFKDARELHAPAVKKALFSLENSFKEKIKK